MIGQLATIHEAAHRARPSPFIVVAILLVSATVASAQSFESGSSGTDGALVVTTPGTYDFYRNNLAISSQQLDQDKDNIFHFTEVTIGSDVTLRLTGQHFPEPIVWLTSGEVKILGNLNLDGENSLQVSTAERRPSIPGAGGYSGGTGGDNSKPAYPGTGPGGGIAGVLGGPGHVYQGRGGVFSGNQFLVPLIGGSGGGGGLEPCCPGSRSGGAGGGALLIASSVSINISERVSANGGNGTNFHVLGNGGGGSGGGIRLVAPLIYGSGQLEARGGPAQHSGGNGVIRVESFLKQFSDVSNPQAIAASPYNLFLDRQILPKIKVVSIDGIAVSTNVSGFFEMPDVSFENAEDVAIEIVASGVPPGTTVDLQFFSENAPDKSVQTPPLAGTMGQSSVTADVQVPLGFSRGFARAKW